MITLDEQIEWGDNMVSDMAMVDVDEFVTVLVSDAPIVSAILATLRSVKASQQAEPVAWVLVPKEPTEAEIDAPRYFLSGLELGIKSVGPMREHLTNCGCDLSSLPEWFRTCHADQHLTKSGKAICIRALMLAAAPAAPQSGWVSKAIDALKTRMDEHDSFNENTGLEAAVQELETLDKAAPGREG